MFGNIPDAFYGVCTGMIAFIIIVLIMMAVIINKAKPNESVGCGTPLIIALVLSVIIGIAGAFYFGQSPEEAQRWEEYREYKAEDNTVKCPVCKREFQKGSDDAHSIKWNNMCDQCYKNYKYASDALH